VLFFFPVWQYLKKYVVVYRALEGINAVVVGLMFGSTIYLLKDIAVFPVNSHLVLNIAVTTGTLLVLLFTKVPPPLIVLFCLVAGWIL
jgi:chromate transporter